MGELSDYADRTRIAHEVAGRLLVSVRVTPRAAKDELACESGVLRVKLHAPPVDGAANAALLAFFSARLRLPKRAIVIERGATSRQKVIAIIGLSMEEFWRRLGV